MEAGGTTKSLVVVGWPVMPLNACGVSPATVGSTAEGVGRLLIAMHGPRLIDSSSHCALGMTRVEGAAAMAYDSIGTWLAPSAQKRTPSSIQPCATMRARSPASVTKR